MIDICINRYESQKVVDNYFVGTKKRESNPYNCRKLLSLFLLSHCKFRQFYGILARLGCTHESFRMAEDCSLYSGQALKLFAR